MLWFSQGEHAPYFVRELGDSSPTWQPTDVSPEACASCDARAKSEKVLSAKVLDVCSTESWPLDDGIYGACLMINVLHIAPHSCARTMFRGVAKALRPGGVFGIYDTWTFEGKFVGPNNAQFDKSLRARGCSGIMSIEECHRHASEHGLVHSETLYLPANNQFVVYVKKLSA